jgi:hypothetical protein
MPSIACPNCQQPLLVETSQAGQVVVCPTCQKKLRLPKRLSSSSSPAPSADDPVADDVVAPPPPPAASPSPVAPATMPSLFTTPLTIPPASPQQQHSFAPPDESPPFRPRQYPAMRIIIVICYVLTVLVAISFVISEIVVFTGGAAAILGGRPTSPFARSSGNVGMTFATIFVFLITQVTLVAYHGLAALLFVAWAESIRVWLDIQNNTHEAAHYSRQIPSRQRT